MALVWPVVFIHMLAKNRVPILEMKEKKRKKQYEKGISLTSIHKDVEKRLDYHGSRGDHSKFDLCCSWEDLATV